MCFRLSSYVGGGRSQCRLKLPPKSEKNLEEDLTEWQRISSMEDLTDHWMRILAKQDMQRSIVMARRM